MTDKRLWQRNRRAGATTAGCSDSDLPGFGNSPITKLPVTYATDVAALLDECRFKPAILVGASLGARTALELAVARGDLVNGLVLVGADLPGGSASVEPFREGRVG